MKHGTIALLFSSVLLSGCVSVTPDTLPDPLAAGWAGQPVCEQLHRDDKQRVLRCAFAPGVGHERHFHAAHFGYALSGGRMRLVDARGERTVELATGSHFSSAGVAWHEVLNVGDTPVVYLIIEPLACIIHEPSQ